MDDFTANTPDRPIEPLTRREREILALLAGEKSNQEIADQLFLALSSLKWYVGQIYQKLEVSNRRQAVHRAQELGLLEGSAPPPALKHNLPGQLTSFIGRDQEIAQVVNLIEQHALVTLVGPGGVGKTRLALAVAEYLASEFPGSSSRAGVWLVDLAPVTNPDLIPQTILFTLGLQVEPNQPVVDNLCKWLKNRKILLLLDNCEHLGEACAGLSVKMLRAAPGLKVLVTSREMLGITGEVIYRVPSLSLPPAGGDIAPDLLLQSEAGRLFMERASAALFGFEIDPRTANLIAHICQRLNGIPLAIELAAARLTSLDVEQIAVRIDQSIRMLTGNSRASLERHRTLRAAIEWSYNLLSDKERRLLQRLAVFVGGWGVEAAEEVCQDEDIDSLDVFELLSNLVNKSMVQMEPQPGREMRYRMLEMIRQFAAEKLVESGDSDHRRRKYCAWFEQMVAKSERKLRTKDLVVCLKELDTERDNLRAVLEWALDENADPLAGLRIANNLKDYWDLRGFISEGYCWLEKSLEAALKDASSPLALQARTMISLVVLLDWWAKPTLAVERLNQALEICRSLGPEGVWDRAEALAWLGWLNVLDFGELTMGLSLINESEVIYRGLGEAGNWDLTAVLSGKSYIYLLMDNLAEAQSCAEAGWTLAQGLDPRVCGRSLTDLGDVAFRRGDFSQAREYLLKGLVIFQELEDRNWIATIDKKLGILEKNEARYHQANQFFKESLKIFANSISLDNGALQVVECMAINEITWAASIQSPGHFQTGARLMGLDEKLCHELGVPVYIETRQEFDQASAILHEQLDPDSLASAWAAGRAMTLEEAVEFESPLP